MIKNSNQDHLSAGLLVSLLLTEAGPSLTLSFRSSVELVGTGDFTAPSAAQRFLDRRRGRGRAVPTAGDDSAAIAVPRTLTSSCPSRSCRRSWASDVLGSVLQSAADFPREGWRPDDGPVRLSVTKSLPLGPPPGRNVHSTGLLSDPFASGGTLMHPSLTSTSAQLAAIGLRRAAAA